MSHALAPACRKPRVVAPMEEAFHSRTIADWITHPAQRESGRVHRPVRGAHEASSARRPDAVDEDHPDQRIVGEAARQRPPRIQRYDVEEPHDLTRFGGAGALAHAEECAQVGAAEMRLLRGIK